MTSQSIHNEAAPSEVGWQFVRRYYEYTTKQPQILYRFYAEPSAFSHATEGEDDKPARGLQVLVPERGLDGRHTRSRV